MQYYYDDAEFGRVLINTRRGMRNITARWRGEQLLLNAPYGIIESEIKNALDDLRVRLRSRREQQPQITFTIGQVIDCFGCQVKLVTQRHSPNRMLFGHDGEMLTLALPEDMDLTANIEKKNVSYGLQVLLEQQAKKLLLPYAAQVAQEVGIAPARWEVGRGMRKLGHCTTKAPHTIQLSRNLMFLNERLVRYIICHELAHLTHGNHSAAFHALVNQYTNGQENALEQELRQFQWPIIK